jgi:hypothetical protein
MDGTFRFRFAAGEKMMSTALLLGLIWSGLWMAFLYMIMKYFPWKMLHDYPEDVRKASTLPEPTTIESDYSASPTECRSLCRLYSFFRSISVVF